MKLRKKHIGLLLLKDIFWKQHMQVYAHLFFKALFLPEMDKKRFEKR